MTKALIMTIQDWYESQPQKYKIDQVHLIVGEFTCVEPTSLEFAFEVQTRNTFLENAQLVIKDVPLVAFCHGCDLQILQRRKIRKTILIEFVPKLRPTSGS